MTTMTNIDSHVTSRVAATEVTVGVDTHLDSHVAVALDQIGQILGVASFGADPTGYRALIAWSNGSGRCARSVWRELAATGRGWHARFVRPDTV